LENRDSDLFKKGPIGFASIRPGLRWKVESSPGVNDEGIVVYRPDGRSLALIA